MPKDEMSETQQIRLNDFSVLKRWAPSLLLAASGLIWAIRLEGRLNGVEKDGSTTSANVSDVQKEVSGLRTDITKFQGTADTLRIMIESVKEGLTRIERKLDDLQANEKRGGK